MGGGVIVVIGVYDGVYIYMGSLWMWVGIIWEVALKQVGRCKIREIQNSKGGGMKGKGAGCGQGGGGVGTVW